MIGIYDKCNQVGTFSKLEKRFSFFYQLVGVRLNLGVGLELISSITTHVNVKIIQR